MSKKSEEAKGKEKKKPRISVNKNVSIDKLRYAQN